jgi:TRAP-type C4-dicarboxylate transport system permease small subunit
MPLHPIHAQKKYKNYAMLAVLAGLMGLFFVLTIVKVADGNKRRLAEKQAAYEQEQQTEKK